MLGPVICTVTFAFKLEVVGLKTIMDNVATWPLDAEEGGDKNTVGVGDTEPVTVSD